MPHSLREREAEGERGVRGGRGRAPQLQLVYSISIINELLGIFVAYAGRDAQPKGETKSTAVAQQFALTALRCLDCVDCAALPGPASPLAANSCRCENLMYKYNLPHTQTLMWPPTGRRQLPVDEREEQRGVQGVPLMAAKASQTGSLLRTSRNYATHIAPKIARATS